ncbi:mitochondrial carrier [Mycena belliarum]|uniref:Mitochondrial carrier n=1 Tax=Mycena belliarum TaxID=1033014 RepID=A0AAD6UHM9_9AGAR|nr:mitochondrial carrier [Mycena belliae]
MTSTLPPLVQAFSGAIGSASANTLTYPLDLVTTRLQLDSPQKARRSTGLYRAIRILRGIIRKHGVQDLYSGLGTDTGATLLANFLYFYCYAFLRYLLTRRRLTLNPKASARSATPHKPSLLEEVLLGFVAGIASRAVSTPLNIVTLRLQAENDNDNDNDNDNEDEETASEKSAELSGAGVASVVKKIYNEQGVGGFWRGFKMTMLLSLNPALTLALFQLYRRVLGHANPTPTQAFLGAAVSNSIAAGLLYPLMLAKTRVQATAATSMRAVLHDAYAGTARASEPATGAAHAGVGQDVKSGGSLSQGGKENLAGRGLAGLYQGLEMQILKGFLSQGVTFLVKGRVEEAVVALYARRTRSG